MVNFLKTAEITFRVEQLCDGAKEELILISPYFKGVPRLRSILEHKDRNKIDIQVLYGKDELQPGVTWLKSTASVRLRFCKNLHAKCFLNESELVITSMNLFEYSQANNEEMGVHVMKAEDPALYASVREEAKRLFRISEPDLGTVEKVLPAVAKVDAKVRRG